MPSLLWFTNRWPSKTSGIYAAVPDHPLGRRVRTLFTSEPTAVTGAVAGIGSVLLIPELLTKPLRDNMQPELEALTILLARLDLRPTDEAVAQIGAALGAAYGLRAADAGAPGNGRVRGGRSLLHEQLLGLHEGYN